MSSDTYNKSTPKSSSKSIPIVDNMVSIVTNVEKEIVTNAMTLLTEKENKEAFELLNKEQTVLENMIGDENNVIVQKIIEVEVELVKEIIAKETIIAEEFVTYLIEEEKALIEKAEEVVKEVVEEVKSKSFLQRIYLCFFGCGKKKSHPEDKKKEDK